MKVTAPHLAFAVGAFLLMAAACDDGPPLTPGVPDIAFAQTRHDFGTLSDGAVAEHVFTFRNNGTEPLELGKPKGS